MSDPSAPITTDRVPVDAESIDAYRASVSALLAACVATVREFPVEATLDPLRGGQRDA